MHGLVPQLTSPLETPQQAASLQSLAAVLAQENGLVFAILVGSRATGKHRPDSDWDIALMWQDGMDGWTLLGQTETL